MPTDLLTYQGNAGLGIGSSPEIPISPNKDLDVVNQAARDLVYNEAARNTLIYQKKIAEHNDLMQNLLSGKVKVGQVLPEDMPEVMKHLEGQTQSGIDWLKKGYNDWNGAANYKNKTNDAELAVAAAQSRYINGVKMKNDIATETVPKIKAEKQKAYDKYISGGLFQPYEPYQEVMRFMPNAWNETLQQQENKFVDKKTSEAVSEKYYSLSDAINKNQALYATDQGREAGRLLYDELSKNPDLVASVNSRLDKYNKDIGNRLGGKDVATPIDPRIDTPAVMAAKFALSQVPQFLISDRKTDNSLLDYRAAMGRLGLDYTKLNRQQIEDKYGADSALYQVAEAIRGGVKKTITIPGGKGIFGKAPQTREVVEIGDPNLIKEFATIDKEGNVTETPDAVQYDKDKNQLYLIYNKSDGTPDDSKTKSINASQYMGQVVRRLNPNKDIGGVNLEVTNQLRKYGGSLDELAKNYGKQTQPATTNPKQPKAATGKMYRVNGVDYSDQEVEDAAKQLGMTQAAYMKKYGIK